MLNKEQIEFFLVKAYNASLRAGARILEIYENSGDLAVDMKSDNTPITVADRDAHNIIKSYLNQTRIPLLSEEGRDILFEERRGWDLFWMVDPLDGTKEFIKGNGEFTVNIALMYDNKPTIGIIYVPFIRKAYFAVKGHGAYVRTEVEPDAGAEITIEDVYVNTIKLPLREKSNDPIRIAMSRSHNTPETYDCIDELKRQYPGAEVIEQGSSYKFCMLAEGAVETYFRTSPTCEWDTAAGELILDESGGAVFLFDGTRGIEYNKPSLVNPHFVCKSAFMQ